MRSSKRIICAAATIALLAACGPPTVDEVEGRSFSSVAEFEDALRCSEHFTVFPSWSGQPPIVATEDEALEMAMSLLDGSQQRAVGAIEAGEVWVLVDAEGFAFAAMETVGASTGGCWGH